MTIRFACATDTPALMALIRELAGYEKLTHELVGTEDGLRECLFGPRPVAEALMAFAGDDGLPIGYAIFVTSFSTFLTRRGIYLEDIYVQPDQRGRGVGTALLRRVVSIARERGCGRVEWMVLDWNQPAIDFYRSIGARALDGWTTFRLDGEALDRLGSPAPDPGRREPGPPPRGGPR